MKKKKFPLNPLMSKSKNNETTLLQRGTPFFLVMGSFAILFFVTAMLMNTKNKSLFQVNLPADGGTLKPFTIDQGNTVVEIKVTQRLRRKFNWIYNYCDILDAEGETVYGFGKEFWWESGYDDGHWEEKDITLNTKITFPFPGTYQLKFSTERSPGEENPMSIRVVTRRGSGLFCMTTTITIVLSLILLGWLWSKGVGFPPPPSKTALLIITGLMSFLYAMALYLSLQGWGYPGYYGYHQPSSWTYINGSVQYYPEKSLRDGSVHGPNRKGGGPKSGK
jgi:hypothetical protein